MKRPYRRTSLKKVSQWALPMAGIEEIDVTGLAFASGILQRSLLRLNDKPQRAIERRDLFLIPLQWLELRLGVLSPQVSLWGHASFLNPSPESRGAPG